MEEYDPNEPTYPCKFCQRRFVRSSLEKHEPVCKKLAKLNRKPFDSGKQRATGSDITIHDVRRAAKEKEKLGGQFPRPKTQWKQRHEEFIDAVSSSKKVDYALKTGAPLPPPPRTAIPNDVEWPPPRSFLSDFVECHYCGRRFNERAAERHIPFCKDQHAKKGVAVKPLPASVLNARGLPTQQQRREADSSASRAGRETRGRTASERRRSLESRASPSRGRASTKSATQHATFEQPPPTALRENGFEEEYICTEERERVCARLQTEDTDTGGAPLSVAACLSSPSPSLPMVFHSLPIARSSKDFFVNSFQYIQNFQINAKDS